MENFEGISNNLPSKEVINVELEKPSFLAENNSNIIPTENIEAVETKGINNDNQAEVVAMAERSATAFASFEADRNKTKYVDSFSKSNKSNQPESREEKSEDNEHMFPLEKVEKREQENLKEYFRDKLKQLVAKYKARMDLSREGSPGETSAQRIIRNEILQLTEREVNLIILHNILYDLAKDPRLTKSQVFRIRCFDEWLEEDKLEQHDQQMFARGFVDAMKEILPDDMAQYFESLIPRDYFD